jgi:hypothetical protein
MPIKIDSRLIIHTFALTFILKELSLVGAAITICLNTLSMSFAFNVVTLVTSTISPTRNIFTELLALLPDSLMSRPVLYHLSLMVFYIQILRDFALIEFSELISNVLC